ncbi:hypothetical protein ACFWNN_04995 [Lentzea sp. NPDC058450]
MRSTVAGAIHVLRRDPGSPGRTSYARLSRQPVDAALLTEGAGRPARRLR